MQLIAIYGNSQVVIVCLTGSLQVRNIHNQAYVDRAKPSAGSFKEMRFPHIYQEVNTESDVLANGVVDLEEGSLLVEELREDGTYTLSL